MREIAHVFFAEADDAAGMMLCIDKPLKDQEVSRVVDPAAIPEEDRISRSSLRVREGMRASFGSYFNAFPAGYWQWWTSVTEVTLRVSTSGSGRIIVHSSRARSLGTTKTNTSGRSGKPAFSSVVMSKQVSGEGQTTEFTLPLKNFGDGGWYWFDLVASADEPIVLNEALWLAADNGRHGTVTLGMTTFNRPADAVQNVLRVAGAAELDDCVREMLVVDQGNKQVEDDPRYAEASTAMKGRLRVIKQGNMGGSGGYARGMYETVKGSNGTTSDYFMTLDDDIEIEPESIFRACVFADYLTHPAIVGSHMFDINRRSSLLAYAEVVDEYRFNWGPIPGLGDIDFSDEGLRSIAELHRRWDADYNGWWMCLIPRTIIEEIGLPLPVFIKWDDSEYSLRARAQGYPTISLPGSATWHASWIDKDDATDWQAYFHERNRLIAALLHSPYAVGGRMVRESVNVLTKHALSMQYYAATLVAQAIDDVFAGPDRLHGMLESKAAEMRAMKDDFVDGPVITDLSQRPAIRAERAVPRITKAKQPNPRTLIPWAATVAIRQVFKKPTELSRSYPERAVARGDAAWYYLPKLDSALVSNSTGNGVSLYQRDPQQARKFLGKDLVLHAQLAKAWPRLARTYRQALPRITSMEEWGKTFAKYPEQD
ncbi:glycosyltransferase family 2 protein [Propionibacterium australiense]|uniref:Glycosyltransferase family 2 protein n=1 Tax=Propionibacterium australiense TaxID=119981 RepID=A0A8B3FK45_9ACTN|nr:glycosyltransferase family 2 protein [Propionibacterium australiense]RLP07874.1 glycosyltransferase family 2 protein [Propionibacterium australiense]